MRFIPYMFLAPMLVGPLITARAESNTAAIDCAQPFAEQKAPISHGEWILRCQFQDAQPQYLAASLLRLLSADSFGRLKDEGLRKTIFESYGLFFDDLRREPLPMGMNFTKEKFVPPMVNQNGKASTRALAKVLINKNPRLGLTLNCLACHTGVVPTTVDGRGAISFGTPNVFIDLQKIHEDFAQDLAQNQDEQRNYPGSGSVGHAIERNPQRNSFVNAADYLGVISRLVRQPFPSVKLVLLMDLFYSRAGGSDNVANLSEVAQEQPYLKALPWSGYRYKKPLDQLYVDGGLNGGRIEAVTYRLGFSRQKDGSDYKQFAHDFNDHVPEFMSQIEPPVYPFPIQAEAVRRGHLVYQENCSSCHGSFDHKDARSGWVLDYPGLLVEDVGTDAQRQKFFEEFVPKLDAHFPREKSRDLETEITIHQGYVAPPLVGIWARAPYLHNASVATIRQLLGRPSDRFKKFGIWPRPTEHKYYDQSNVGWVAKNLSDMSQMEIDAFLASDEGNKNLRIYNPEVRFRFYEQKQVPGLSNQGHDLGRTEVGFSGYLEEQELNDILEFLKTI